MESSQVQEILRSATKESLSKYCTVYREVVLQLREEKLELEKANLELQRRQLNLPSIPHTVTIPRNVTAPISRTFNAPVQPQASASASTSRRPILAVAASSTSPQPSSTQPSSQLPQKQPINQEVPQVSNVGPSRQSVTAAAIRNASSYHPYKNGSSTQPNNSNAASETSTSDPPSVSQAPPAAYDGPITMEDLEAKFPPPSSQPEREGMLYNMEEAMKNPTLYNPTRLSWYSTKHLLLTKKKDDVTGDEAWVEPDSKEKGNLWQTVWDCLKEGHLIYTTYNQSQNTDPIISPAYWLQYQELARDHPSTLIKIYDWVLQKHPEARSEKQYKLVEMLKYQCKKIRSGGKKRTRSSISGGENNENGDSEMDQSLDGTKTELNQQLDNALSGLSS